MNIEYGVAAEPVNIVTDFDGQLLLCSPKEDCVVLQFDKEQGIPVCCDLFFEAHMYS